MIDSKIAARRNELIERANIIIARQVSIIMRMIEQGQLRNATRGVATLNLMRELLASFPTTAAQPSIGGSAISRNVYQLRTWRDAKQDAKSARKGAATPVLSGVGNAIASYVRMSVTYREAILRRASTSELTALSLALHRFWGQVPESTQRFLIAPPPPRITPFS